MIASVVSLGEQKYVNTEAPKAIEGVKATTAVRYLTTSEVLNAITGPMPNRLCCGCWRRCQKVWLNADTYIFYGKRL
jgi:hypothetical protein